jgi:hypothetical protein
VSLAAAEAVTRPHTALAETAPVASVGGPPAAASAPAPPGAPVSSQATASSEATAPPTAAPSPPAASPERPAEGVAAFVRGRVELGCDYRAHVVAEHQILVACGAAGLVILAPSGESYAVVERRPAGPGAVVDFFEQGGAIWARLVEERALQVASGRIVARGSESSPEAAPVSTPTATPAVAAVSPAVPVTGQVVSVRNRLVIINLGRQDGVKLGDRIAFFEAAPDDAKDYEFTKKSAVVGVVVDTAAATATVRIGLLEAVSQEALVAVSGSAATASRINPPRAAKVWELSALVRPGLSLGDAGGLVEAEVEAGYRAESWVVGAVVSPIGFGGSRGHALLGFGAAHVYGAFDGQVFAAGIGLGITGVNDTGGASDGGTGLAVHEMLRVGALDGLNLVLRSSLAIFRSTIQFANIDVQGQVAVANDAWLVLRGGGGVVGYAYSEVAVRALTSGNGGAGSSFIEVGLGGSASFVNTCVATPVASPQQFVSCDDKNFLLGGPHLSLGMEWRL